VKVWNWIQNAVTTAASALWTWFGNFGTWIWNHISGLGKAIAKSGAQIGAWIQNAVTTAAKALWTWFSNFGTWIWNALRNLAKIIGTSGSNIWKWFSDAVTNAATGLWTWFSGMGKTIWTNISKWIGDAVTWGENIVTGIIQGIGNMASKLWDAITNLFTGKSGNGAGRPGGVIPFPKLPGQAEGGHVRGPGGPTDDKVLRRLSNGEFVVKARQVKKHRRLVEAINNDQLIPGLADGGIVHAPKQYSTSPIPGFDPTKDLYMPVGVSLGDMWAKAGMKDPTFMKAALAKSGLTPISLDPALTNNQNPASFGWAVGKNIVPFNFNGIQFPAGVASGTESIWRAFLTQLEPSIPGGIRPGEDWGYEDRANVNNPSMKSFHAYGLALDVNSSENPNLPGTRGSRGNSKYMIPNSADALAKKYGMLWGGEWGDAMHFELHLSPADIAKNASIGGTAPSVPVTGVPGDVTQWAGLFTQALQKVNMFTQPNLIAGLNRMHVESSGNPKAINLWDANAQKGTPSKGLMQVIDPTFARYSQFGYTDNIWDPLSNILASINYTAATYPSLIAGWAGTRGYSLGGLVNGIGTSTSDSNLRAVSNGEFILTTEQYQKNKAVIDAIYAGKFDGSNLRQKSTSTGTYQGTGSAFSNLSSGANIDNSTTININGDLSFPNIQTGSDAQTLIDNVSRLAKIGAR
jgi:SLT domain-containing protein